MPLLVRVEDELHEDELLSPVLSRTPGIVTEHTAFSGDEVD